MLALQTQAQTLCDSNITYTTGSQMQLEVAIPVTGNNLPFMAPLYAVTYGDGNMLAEDSCFSGPCTHMVYNYNPNGTYYDTLTTCISYTVTDTMGYVDTLMCPADSTVPAYSPDCRARYRRCRCRTYCRR